jgi:serine/threonine protein kinase
MANAMSPQNPELSTWFLPGIMHSVVMSIFKTTHLDIVGGNALRCILFRLLRVGNYGCCHRPTFMYKILKKQQDRHFRGLAADFVDLCLLPENRDVIFGGYRAPEISIGAKPTKASDLYAMGVILEELCKHAAIHGGPGQAELRSMAQQLRSPERRRIQCLI